MHINKPEVLAALLAQEDTTGSKTITVEDKGPKHFTVRAANGDALEVRGTYHLANLLQEIWLGEAIVCQSLYGMLYSIEILRKVHRCHAERG